ncbi:MAG: hypothetical protein ACOH2V_00530 [Candidatus Saccharimonadaceae bacterium]
MIDAIRLKAHLNNGETEYIMCSANHYDDGNEYLFQPYNIDKGFIVGGWRHSSCGMSYMAAVSAATQWDDCEQGFLTTKNRFLTREEALKLVISTGQHDGNIIGGVLTSEDLW